MAELLRLTPRIAQEMLREGRIPAAVLAPGVAWCTMEEAAAILRTTPYTGRKYVWEGKLPGLKLGRNTVRVSRADLEAFLPKRGAGSEREAVS